MLSDPNPVRSQLIYIEIDMALRADCSKKMEQFRYWESFERGLPERGRGADDVGYGEREPFEKGIILDNLHGIKCLKVRWTPAGFYSAWRFAILLQVSPDQNPTVL